MKEGKKLLAKIYLHVSNKVLGNDLPENFEFNVEFERGQYNSIVEFVENSMKVDTQSQDNFTLVVLSHEINIKLKPEITAENIDLNESE